MVELSTPVEFWCLQRQLGCNRRVAGSIPVRFNIFYFSTVDDLNEVSQSWLSQFS